MLVRLRAAQPDPNAPDALPTLRTAVEAATTSTRVPSRLEERTVATLEQELAQAPDAAKPAKRQELLAALATVLTLAPERADTWAHYVRSLRPLSPTESVPLLNAMAPAATAMRSAAFALEALGAEKSSNSEVWYALTTARAYAAMIVDNEALQNAAARLKSIADDASLDAKAKKAGASEILATLAPLVVKYPTTIYVHVMHGYAALLAENEVAGRRAAASIIRLEGNSATASPPELKGSVRALLDAFQQAGWIDPSSPAPAAAQPQSQPASQPAQLSSPDEHHAPLRVLSGHSDWVRSAAFSPDGRFIVTASDDKAAIVWDAASGERLRTLSGHSGWVNSAAFSPDGRFIVTASNDKTAIVWDAASGERLRTLSGHSDWVRSAAFSPDGRFIVTASDDKAAIVWDAASGERLRTLSGHSKPVTSAAFSPDGRFIVTGSWDETAMVWNAASGERLRTLSGHSDWVRSAAFSPDGRFIVTASNDKTAIVWDAASGERLRTLPGNRIGVTSAVFSPDGRFIVTGSGFRATVWDAASGQRLRSLDRDSGLVFSVAFSPDGRSIVTASGDNAAIVWSFAP